MTSLEKQLTKAIERLQNEHSEQMQQLSLQVKILSQQVTDLLKAYSDLEETLNRG